jgi:hypothetical protein
MSKKYIIRIHIVVYHPCYLLLCIHLVKLININFLLDFCMSYILGWIIMTQL